jgi:A/G-specific adenine glycosylase
MKRVGATKSGILNKSGRIEQVDVSLADPDFSAVIINWQKQHGRHKLPWQNTRDPYRIWLSEIMLQQTQVAAVIPYYQRFLERFPSVESLAAAPAEEVMAYWSGLGYYSRARNLHRCAQRICEEYRSVFPADPELLAQLPGIGRSTAAAISAFAYGTRAAILDGNVKRVFCRTFGIEGYPGEKRIEDKLWHRAEALMPEQDVEAYTQGLMDLGATVCTRNSPACSSCPMRQRCVAASTDRVKELPVRKPKKVIPERHTAMLVVIDRGQILLEQRPPVGIWGGLLSLPELAAALPDEGGFSNVVSDSAIADAVARFGMLASCEPLARLTHGFTHFKLHISPIWISLARRVDFVGEGSYVWYDAEKIPYAPLPAPVKKLLLEVFNGATQRLLIST